MRPTLCSLQLEEIESHKSINTSDLLNGQCLLRDHCLKARLHHFKNIRIKTTTAVSVEWV